MQDLSEDVIKRAAGGDLEAFELIYRTTSGFVFNVAFRIINNWQDAQEVTQEVFLTVHRKLNSFQFQSSFKTWVYRVTANAAINYSKKNSRIRNRHVQLDEQTDAGIPEQARKMADEQHHEEVIQVLLNSLNEDQRACVVLRNMQGLSYQQIADTLGININTVRSRLKRAREILVSARNEVMGHAM